MHSSPVFSCFPFCSRPHPDVISGHTNSLAYSLLRRRIGCSMAALTLPASTPMVRHAGLVITLTSVCGVWRSNRRASRALLPVQVRRPRAAMVCDVTAGVVTYQTPGPSQP